MTDAWNGYIVFERVITNLNESNWVTLLNLVKTIISNGQKTHQKLHWRGNADTFVLNDKTYSNEYIFQASFNLSDITLEKFRLRLVNAFEVADNTVTYSVSKVTLANRQTVIAIYKHNTVNQFRVAFLGVETADSVSTREESAHEARALIASGGWDI